MSIIQHILKEELERLENLLLKYEDDLKKLPKGSISKKLRNGLLYFYRAQRVREKVKFEYLGKESSAVVKEAIGQNQKRLNFLQKLRQVNKDIKEIKRASHGKRG